MELEEEYKTKGANGTRSETAYTVEARFNYNDPVQIGKQIFDNRYRRVDYDIAPIGVPAAPKFSRMTLEHGMFGYTAAQALRWWLHANADAIGKGFCLETRLIEHKLHSEYSITAVAQHKFIGGEDRSSCVPNWGK